MAEVAQVLTISAVVLLVGNAFLLLLSRDWRWTLLSLGAQFLLAFWMISRSWPLELAAVKLVGGWMATAVLGLTLLNQLDAPPESESLPSSRPFLAMAAALVIVIVSGVSPELSTWSRQLDASVTWSGLFLIGIGLLQVGMSASLFRSALGLLTLLSGFEILYAALETSILVAGLLAFLSLGVALAAAYLMLTPSMEAEQ